MAYYESWYDRLGEAWVDKAPQAILADIPMRVNYVQQVASKNPSATKFLDLGAGGMGLMAEALAKTGALVTVVDKDKRVLELANAHATKENITGIVFREGNFAALPADEAEFDVVYAYGVLEHAGANLGQWLSEVRRVLKPGGKFIYNAINRTSGSKIMFLTIHAKLLKIDPVGHHKFEWFVAPAQLQTALAQNQLAHQEQIGLMSVKPKPLALLSAITRKGLVGDYKFGDDLSVVYMGYATR